VISKVNQLTITNADIYRDEVTDVLADVLLHRIAPINVRANLAKDFVPRTPNLGAQVATQWRQVFVEATIAIARTRAQSHRTIKVVAQSSSDGVASFPTTGALNDYFVHVFAHHNSQ
jgi:hypothetical protein